MSLFNKEKKVLIIEDEPDIAEALQARLSVEGYVVSIANDGQKGIEAARKLMPDLIILDVMLPVLNGFDACKVLKEDDKTKARQNRSKNG